MRAPHVHLILYTIQQLLERQVYIWKCLNIINIFVEFVIYNTPEYTCAL